MNNKLLGKQINKTRKEKGFTSEKLAELVHIDATYLRQIESGRGTPSLFVFTEICNCLHVSPDYLLQGNLEKNELSYISELSLLLENATPKEIELSTVMIKSALEYLQKKE